MMLTERQPQPAPLTLWAAAGPAPLPRPHLEVDVGLVLVEADADRPQLLLQQGPGGAPVAFTGARGRPCGPHPPRPAPPHPPPAAERPLPATKGAEDEPQTLGPVRGEIACCALGRRPGREQGSAVCGRAPGRRWAAMGHPGPRRQEPEPGWHGTAPSSRRKPLGEAAPGRLHWV